ncbi:MAG: type I DNA topoisomerase [Candidatus Cloacimonadaceae bacterium]|jgi:DNA topoisomerase-1|nr:type I DNA topoisomerase [Candidatus Cloacimonadota bacterium]MDX9949722.1 type I DNA topoisomerase [Candidatus Syntrophosphaera sp.]
MNKALIIVESFAKAGTINKILGGKYSVKASIGHIRDLPKNTMGVDVEHNFSPVYEIDKKKSKTVADLRTAAKGAEEIFLASDPDREGEAIAWHLSKVLEKEIAGKKVHRIVFNEITSKAVKAAMEQPGDVDMAKVDAQQARRVLDRIVGYTVSPLLWKVIAKDLSAGRVQSVALRLICEREEEIEAFVPREFWKLEASFWRDALPPFKASLEKWQGKKFEIPDEKTGIEISETIKNADATLGEIKRTLRDLQPPPPFITSTLQQEASKILNFSSERTMAIAQELYEGIELKGETTGLITYMRTDSVRVAPEAVENCRTLVKERFGEQDIVPNPRFFKTKKSAQDAHEAIRPTDAFRTPESIAAQLSKEQLKLYTLIWQRFVATQMKPAKLENTSAKIGLGEAVFAATGNRVVEQGFMKAWAHVYFVEGAQIHADYTKNDALEHDAIKRSQHFTKPPARYTEASLIKLLEAQGIGRPSTYSSIISTIRKRDYVKIQKKVFFPTDLGKNVNSFLVKNFDAIFNVSFTAEMEDRLDQIEEKQSVWYETVKLYYDELMKFVADVDLKKEKKAFTEETDITCDVCGEGKMVVKRSRNGEFLGCNRFPECRNIKNFSRTEDGKIEILMPKVLEEKCPQCGSALIVRSGRYGEFTACSNYPKCKYIKKETTGVACPECGKGELAQRKNKRGNLFYSCTRYPECKYLTNKKPLPIACPNCGNPYIEEHYSKERGSYKKCPKCNTEME